MTNVKKILFMVLKGSVGKTATTVNLASALTRANKTELVPQHNATQILTLKGVKLT